jgi:hypothetical protein
LLAPARPRAAMMKQKKAKINESLDLSGFDLKGRAHDPEISAR